MQQIQIGNVELNVVIQGSGQLVLLVHGFPLDHTMWQGQIDGLSDTCKIIAPDLRGFGQSDVANGTVTMEQFADDLAELLTSLNVVQPVIFCGLSMGGYIAWQFWKRHRDRLDRLILCDTRAAADTEDVAQFRLETAEQVVAEGPAALVHSMTTKLFSPDTLENRRDVVDATREIMLGTSPASIAAALRGMAQRDDMTEALGDIDVPTLLICGQHDAITTVEEMRGIAKAIPGATFAEIADAGHMAPLEKPAIVNTRIRQFLQLD